MCRGHERILNHVFSLSKTVSAVRCAGVRVTWWGLSVKMAEKVSARLTV